MSAVVVALIRAAATEYARGVRQMWLFGLTSEDELMRNYMAAQRVRFH